MSTNDRNDDEFDEYPDRNRAADRNEKRKVGYGSPPVHTRFKPGVSGNPQGRGKERKLRNIREDLQKVYLQEIAVQEGRTKRHLSAVVLLHERLLRDALKGNPKATSLAIKLAAELGVLAIREKPQLDLSLLKPEERATCVEALRILRATGLYNG